MSWKDYWISIDVETSGVDSKAQVVEFAAVHFSRGKKVHSWSTLICPMNQLFMDKQFQEAMACNQIDPEEIARAHTFQTLVGQIEKELADLVWVGHNVAFDVRMLDYEFKRLSHVMSFRPELTICTMYLDAALMPGEETYQLASTKARWGVPLSASHRAEVDAESSGLVLASMMNELPDDERELQQLLKQGEEAWRRKLRTRSRE